MAAGDILRDAQLEARFWQRVRQGAHGEACWVWTGMRNRAGYGVTSVGEEKHLAHRLAYLLVCGPIPPGMFVRHTCRHRCCVRPDHLFLSDNTLRVRD